MPQDPAILVRPDGTRIAHHHTPAATGNGMPGVVFLGGFKSDMEGGKALRLEAFCRGRGQQFTRFDYRGHGLSSGRFEDGTIGLWLADAVAVLDEVTRGPQILVGSSMGGWIALLAALRRTDRVAGIVGVAPAPDFVVRMEGELSADQRATLAREGRFERPSAYSDDPYVITRALIEDGKRHLLMDAPIPLDLPVRILHGMRDDAVPWQLSLKLCETLTSDDVRVVYVKNGDHRLSEEPELDLLCETVDEVGRRIA
ncbi:pimeloyl-ACP methyl ester carboxylesterase [Constrictibacter sp. MBR-5]|uniref:alpha/beta hydrolase n=1 Tax=Constrictibacter sp. MBR-5 TaxID=3156467 RepID=UPI00339316A1